MILNILIDEAEFCKSQKAYTLYIFLINIILLINKAIILYF